MAYSEAFKNAQARAGVRNGQRPIRGTAPRDVTAAEATPGSDLTAAPWVLLEGYNRMSVVCIPNAHVTSYTLSFYGAYPTEAPVEHPAAVDAAAATETQVIVPLPANAENGTTAQIGPFDYDVSGMRAVAPYISALTGDGSESVQIVVTICNGTGR